MKKVATIILNRNLPEVADNLYESTQKYNGDLTDIYIVEAGSDEDKLSKNHSWWANWQEAMEHGLRTPRGFNYALAEMWKKGTFSQYDFFFLLSNDTEFENVPVIQLLLEELENHPRVGIISPCSDRWGERKLLGFNDTKYFWYIHTVALLLRKEYIEDIMETENPTYMNFLYDGTNFQGYGADSELVVKGYANDWATAITTTVRAEENESYLQTKSDLIKTEAIEELIPKYVEEGRKWMRRKYGFNNRWTMQMYAKFFYEQFFDYFPEFIKFKI